MPSQDSRDFSSLAIIPLQSPTILSDTRHCRHDRTMVLVLIPTGSLGGRQSGVDASLMLQIDKGLFAFDMPGLSVAGELEKPCCVAPETYGFQAGGR